MINFLIHFPTKNDNIENWIIDKQSGSNFAKEMLMIFDRIDCEKDIQALIDHTNLYDFIEDYKTLEDLINQKIGLYNLEELIRNLISQNAIRILHNSSFEPDFHIQILDGFLSVDKIFTENNSDRILNINDFRHCENHRDYLNIKSPLIGGTGGFQNANSLLPSAIGDIKSGRSILLNIDNKNRGFLIRYEDENFNNQYHAFHIVKKYKRDYVADSDKIKLLLYSRKNFKRPLMLIKYRNSILTE
jgi:hypothetical protein